MRWPVSRGRRYKRQKPHGEREALRVLTPARADQIEQVWCSHESYTHL